MTGNEYARALTTIGLSRAESWGNTWKTSQSQESTGTGARGELRLFEDRDDLIGGL